jgi:hypothetical protein
LVGKFNNNYKAIRIREIRKLTEAAIMVIRPRKATTSIALIGKLHPITNTNRPARK